MKETNNVMIFSNEGFDKQIKGYLQEEGGFSSRLLRFVKKEGALYINGKQMRLDQVFRSGEVLEVRMPEEAVDVEGEDKPLDVLYEDLDILVVSKEPNMVTHPTKGHPDNNLANRVAHHFMKSGIAAKIRFVNRLDRDTTGVVVIAKSKFAHQHIQNQMQDKKVEKVYYALVERSVQPSNGVVDLPIGRPSDDSIIRTVMETGKSSTTHYETLYGDSKATLLRLYLETGRTHQIRVHMKAVGHPLIGDTLYNPEGTTFGMDRQALHGGEIRLIQPRTGKRLVIRAPLPEDMKVCMDRMGWPDLMETRRIL
ncbi:RluA family pseudouridine synthase [Alkalibacter rhizosphaerae]|uniref:Pseudouridine synthase n=1 Tax=Alkalibacter rhizosphaerae TaxID=2815577 RepID=A0A974XEG0_9FIRM|nr:RluA family pseudouridine synthase [Alkalibacter rhizosphaerae]QSX08342.1 RluA family pseudouridine synthase [Alkalibacter rhizosphaerae]